MNNIKVKTKISVLVSIMLVAMIGISIFSLRQTNDMMNTNMKKLSDQMYEDYDNEIKGQVNTVISLLDTIYAKYEAGELTKEEAQTMSADFVRELRYKDGGYFWIDTVEGDNIVLLGNETEGTNRYDNVDANGVPFIKDIISAGMQADGGFADYMFSKEGETEASPKRSYSKLYEPYQWVIGTGNYVDDMDDKIALQRKKGQESMNQSINILIALLLITLVITGVLSFFIARGIISALKIACIYLEKLGKGDFSIHLSEKFLSRKDDFGDLAKNINQMKHSVNDLIGKIQEENEVINDVVDKVNDNANKLNDSIQNVSATTQELAAGMEETAASSEEMLATAHAIEESVNNIASRSKEGSVQAVNISKRAKNTKDTVQVSQTKAIALKNEIGSKLESALQQAEVVSQINVLAESIMEITTSTNLLSLNAAIEAARAGEAGKGFAVVAEEIRNLAEQSKTTVVKIQEVTESVTIAVANLSENAKDLLSFVSNDVSKDYNSMLKIADEYSSDADYVDELVREFSLTSEELLMAISDVTQAVNDVAIAAGEGAEGTTEIATKNMDITMKSQEMLELIIKTRESADNLQNEIKKFII